MNEEFTPRAHIRAPEEVSIYEKIFPAYGANLLNAVMFGAMTWLCARFTSGYTGLFIGVPLVIVALVFCLFGNRKKYREDCLYTCARSGILSDSLHEKRRRIYRRKTVFCYVSLLFSGAGTGFSLGTLYACGKCPLPLSFEMMARDLLFFAAVLLLSAVVHIYAEKFTVLFGFLYCVAAIGGTVFFCGATQDIFPLFCTVLLVFYSLNFVFSAKQGSDPLFNSAGYALGVYAVITLIVILILSEGDGFDGIGDIFDFGGGSPRAKRHPGQTPKMP